MLDFSIRAILTSALLFASAYAGTDVQTKPPNLHKTAKLPKDPEKAFILAEKALESKDYAQAVSLFQAILEKFPKHPRRAEVQWGLAEAYRLKGDFREALAEYSRYYQDFGETLNAAEALFRIGGCYESLGDTNTAKLSYKVLIKKFPKSPFTSSAKERLSALASQPGK